VVGVGGSIRLGHKTRGSDTPVSTTGREESISPPKSFSPIVTKESQERERLPQNPEEDVPSTLGAEDIEFVSRLYIEEYTQLRCLTKLGISIRRP